jgi:hypothetical protein
MSDAFDELEKQLRGAVADRRGSGSGWADDGRPGCWSRRRSW